MPNIFWIKLVFSTDVQCEQFIQCGLHWNDSEWKCLASSPTTVLLCTGCLSNLPRSTAPRNYAGNCGIGTRGTISHHKERFWQWGKAPVGSRQLGSNRQRLNLSPCFLLAEPFLATVKGFGRWELLKPFSAASPRTTALQWHVATHRSVDMVCFPLLHVLTHTF